MCCRHALALIRVSVFRTVVMPPKRTAPRKPPQKVLRKVVKARTPTPTPEPDSEDEYNTAVSSWTSEDLEGFCSIQKRATLLSLRDASHIYVFEDATGDEDVTPNSVTATQLIDLLNGTLERGEGNSCLVLGPRGSGKTLVSSS